jgi:hypothetical protein
MSRDFLKRLEKIEERMNPPEPLKFRIEIIFVRPDRTISGRRILESGKPDVIIQDDDDDD